MKKVKKMMLNRKGISGVNPLWRLFLQPNTLAPGCSFPLCLTCFALWFVIDISLGKGIVADDTEVCDFTSN